MALKFKYNKTSLYELSKQLTVREKALPTLKSKEAALRLEIKKLKDKAVEYEVKLAQRLQEVSIINRIGSWTESVSWKTWRGYAYCMKSQPGQLKSWNTPERKPLRK